MYTSNLRTNTTDAILQNFWRHLQDNLTFKVTQISFYKYLSRLQLSVLIHLVAVLIAIDLIGLNVAALFIGKELTGSINQDGQKMLALQVMAKIHELLMLSSLGNIIWSFVISLALSGHGVPFGALSMGEKFSSVSYLWSSQFLSLISLSFVRKKTLVLMALIFTFLGVLVGPTSAIAMAPSLELWPSVNVKLPISTEHVQLHPSVLDAQTLSTDLCTGPAPACQIDQTSASLQANFFSLWGHTTQGGLRGMPEVVNVASAESIRVMHTRLRGPFSLYQPSYSTATVQTIWSADMVNGLRALWFKDNSRKCASGIKGFCNYRDIIWSMRTLQPVVRVACNPFDTLVHLSFPGIYGTGFVKTIDPVMIPATLTALSLHMEWLETSGSNLSAGVLVGSSFLGSNDTNTIFACSIQADWAETEVTTNFLGSPFLMDGAPPAFFNPDSEGSSYVGSRIKIVEAWGKSMDLEVDNISNVTAAQLLYSSGNIPSNVGEARDKLEAVLSVLLAERISWIGAQTRVWANSYNTTELANWNDVLKLDYPSDVDTVSFLTAISGYGYGLYTASGYASGRIFSVSILAMYCLIVFSHVLHQFRHQKGDRGIRYDMLELLRFTLDDQAPVDGNSKTGTPKSVSSKTTVDILVGAGGRTELKVR